MIAFLLSVVLMLADHYGRYTETLHATLTTLVTPLEEIAHYPKQLSLWLQHSQTPLDRLKQENQKLHTENLLLKEQILALSHYQTETERLQQLLGTTATLAHYQPQIAEVIFSSRLPFSQYLEIDKGKLDHIQSGQAVVDSEGILGQTTTITPFSSRVLLITDPDHQMPVRIRRTGQRGMLTGIGHDKLKLDFIPQQSNLKVGDLIESSGLGGVFPLGFPVAQIDHVIAQPASPYLEVTAHPIAKITSAYKVLVLTKPKQSQTK